MQLAERVGIDVDRLRRATAEAGSGRSDGPGRRREAGYVLMALRRFAEYWLGRGTD